LVDGSVIVTSPLKRAFLIEASLFQPLNFAGVPDGAREKCRCVGRRTIGRGVDGADGCAIRLSALLPVMMSASPGGDPTMRRRRRTALLIATTALLTAPPVTGRAADPQPAAVPVPMEGPAQAILADQEFAHMAQAYERSLAELALGRMALDRAEDARVRAIAQASTDLHGRMKAGLEKSAADAGAILPEQPAAEDRRLIARLETLAPPAFDQAYLFDRAQTLMRQANLMEKLRAQADREDVRQLAADVLPDLTELKRQVVDLRADLVPMDDGPVGALPGQEKPIIPPGN